VANSGSTCKMKPIRLDCTKADCGQAVFKYWHTCPECGYNMIEEQAKFCGGCGRPLEFFSHEKCFKDRD